MKYLQNGGFQNNPYMRLTLGLAVQLLAAFGSALLMEAACWPTRFAQPGFVWFKVVAFVCFQLVLGGPLLGLEAFVARVRRTPPAPARGRARRGRGPRSEGDPGPRA